MHLQRCLEHEVAVGKTFGNSDRLLSVPRIIDKHFGALADRNDLLQCKFDRSALLGNSDRHGGVSFRGHGVIARDHLGNGFSAHHIGVSICAARKGDEGAFGNGRRRRAVKGDAVYRERNADGRIDFDALRRRLLAVFEPEAGAVGIVSVIAGLFRRRFRCGNEFQLGNAESRPGIGSLYAVEHDLGGRIGLNFHSAHFVPCAVLYDEQNELAVQAQDADGKAAVAAERIRHVAVCRLVAVDDSILRHGVVEIVHRKPADERLARAICGPRPEIEARVLLGQLDGIALLRAARRPAVFKIAHLEGSLEHEEVVFDPCGKDELRAPRPHIRAHILRGDGDGTFRVVHRHFVIGTISDGHRELERVFACPLFDGKHAARIAVEIDFVLADDGRGERERAIDADRKVVVLIARIFAL